MTIVDFNFVASNKPEAWTPSVVGRVGSANIKVLRMDIVDA
jgi:hypothetical protein